MAIQDSLFGGVTNVRKRIQKYCSEYGKRHYRKNKANILGRKKDRRAVVSERNQRRALEFIRNHPCSCGESDPLVLQFDHNDPSEKFDNVSNMLLDETPWHKIEAEIEKCVVRCANCHSRRTAEQFNNWKWKALQAEIRGVV